MKKLTALFLALVLCLSLCTAAFAEKAITIADIIATYENFPLTKDTDLYWTNEQGTTCYYFNNNLFFRYTDAKSLKQSMTVSVAADGKNYTYSDGTVTYTFIMDDSGVLAAITVSGSTDTKYNGTYGAPPTKYTVTNGTTDMNGNIAIDKASAAKDETVTITVTPAEDYQLKKLTVLSAISIAPPITPAQDASDKTKYTFKMPSYPVRVTAEFEEKAITIADILPDDFPTCVDVLPPNVWVNNNGVYMMVLPYSIEIFTLDEYGNPDYVELVNDIRTATLTKNGNNYTYTNNVVTTTTNNVVTTTFLMSDNGLESVKIEGLTGEYVDFNGTYGAPPTKYTVTFNMGNHGTQIDPQTVEEGNKATKPSDPTAEGWTFGGWYKEAGCTQAWNFGTDKVTANTTLYAKWIADAVQKAAIRGNVKEDGSNVIGATVELFLGTEKVAATVTKDNPAGEYSFDNVENGVYNIVVTKDGKTKTEMVTVDTADNFEKDVELPNKAVSSVVEVQPEVGNVKSEISKTVVGGLDEIAKNTSVSGTDKVTIKLTVEPKDASDVASASEIKALAGSGKTVEFLDMSLWKQTNSENPVDIGSDNDELLTIVIPFDFTGVDVGSVMILRNHGGNTEKLTGTANANSEYFKADEQAGTLTIFAKKFSDYAVAYKEQSTGGHGGGSYTPGHTVTSDLKNVTKVTVDGKVVDSRYYTVSGGNIILSGEFMKTLANGKHTVKLYNGDVVATGTMTVSGNAAVVSAKTADAGIALYGVLSVSSLLGMGWVRKRKH